MAENDHVMTNWSSWDSDMAKLELEKKINTMVEALMLAEDVLSSHSIQTQDVIEKIRNALTQWDGVKR